MQPSTSGFSYAQKTVIVSFFSNGEDEGKCLSVRLNLDSTGYDLKKKIHSKWNIAPALQCLRKNDGSNQVVRDDHVLKDLQTVLFEKLESDEYSYNDNTSDEIDDLDEEATNSKKKFKTAEEERWLEQFFKKKFGITDRF